VCGRHPDQGMAEPLQEESNALINREIAGVHHHRALRVHSRQDTVAAPSAQKLEHLSDRDRSAARL
jgi:hypothetical protein